MSGQPILVLAALWVDADGSDAATHTVSERLSGLRSVSTRGAVVAFDPPGRDLLRDLERFQLEEVGQVVPIEIPAHHPRQVKR